MTHPYRDQPDHAFWSRTVADRPWYQVPFAVESTPLVGPATRIVTAGSCFASNLLRWMPRLGLDPFFVEEPPAYFTDDEVAAHHYREFSARYGNVYTVRQLRQLVEQALGERPMIELLADDGNGTFDLLRPHVRPGGFTTRAEALLDREYHLTCVRRMLLEAEVFVFTLGLTEAWEDAPTGAVFPACPGTAAGTFDPARHRRVNFDYPSVLEDLVWTIDAVGRHNPALQWIVTVSPVPLVATHSSDSVIVASSYSKSVLRAVCGAVTQAREEAHYFPSFEVISSAQSFGQYLASDLREVTDRGIGHVMDLFRQTFVAEGAARPGPSPGADPRPAGEAAAAAVLEAECDELLNDPLRHAG